MGRSGLGQAWIVCRIWAALFEWDDRRGGQEPTGEDDLSRWGEEPKANPLASLYEANGRSRDWLDTDGMRSDASNASAINSTSNNTSYETVIISYQLSRKFCPHESFYRKKLYNEIMQGYLLIILILIMGSVHAARITVGPNEEDYHQIQQAINHASIGDVIEVHSGIYKERLHVTKTMALIGVDTGEGMPVINANGSSSAITLMANGSTVEGFNLTESGHCGCGNAGMQVKSNNNTIRDNVLYKNKYGIFVNSGHFNNTFASNEFLENEIDFHDQGNSTNDSQKVVTLHMSRQT